MGSDEEEYPSETKKSEVHIGLPVCLKNSFLVSMTEMYL